MAKQFRALSNIEHGEDVPEGNQITRFPFGSIVEGLDKDTMKNLWDAGVLEEVDTSEPQVTRTTVTKTVDGHVVDERTDAQKTKDEKKAQADEAAAAKAEADKKAADDKVAAEKAKVAANKPPAAPVNTGGDAPNPSSDKA